MQRARSICMMAVAIALLSLFGTGFVHAAERTATPPSGPITWPGADGESCTPGTNPPAEVEVFTLVDLDGNSDTDDDREPFEDDQFGVRVVSGGCTPSLGLNTSPLGSDSFPVFVSDASALVEIIDGTSRYAGPCRDLETGDSIGTVGTDDGYTIAFEVVPAGRYRCDFLSLNWFNPDPTNPPSDALDDPLEPHPSSTVVPVVAMLGVLLAVGALLLARLSGRR